MDRLQPQLGEPSKQLRLLNRAILLMESAALDFQRLIGDPYAASAVFNQSRALTKARAPHTAGKLGQVLGDYNVTQTVSWATGTEVGFGFRWIQTHRLHCAQPRPVN